MLNVKKLFTKVLTDMKKCEKKTLLWKNASPSSSFGAQTVLGSGRLSGYDAVEIVFNQMTPYQRNYTDKVPITVEDVPASIEGMASHYAGGYRMYIASQNGISFNLGFSSTGQNNNIEVPQLIYGIKGGVLTCLNFITSLLYRERGCCVC